MTATEDYIRSLSRLKSGDLGILRTHAYKDLDESLVGFDLFSGIWWPLRQRNPRTPRRSVAWLIAKLYSSYPVIHADNHHFARQLSLCKPRDKSEGDRFQERFDRMLLMNIDQIEPSLNWSLGYLMNNNKQVDWVKLTDDLSYWEDENIRLKWAKQFLNLNQGD